ncbi:MASE1 domain-containing protein [Comamonas antarctica]|uniref:MASE1 domain-containing protein n=1 Tax=Comamonas antarctica TaxID=2743470 RepID=UPI0028EC6222|nr:MASE1 domain-containing protein [Comamonas antarctica]
MPINVSSQLSAHIPLKDAPAAGLRDPRALAAAVALGLAYFLGAKLGMTFSARTYPVSLLWPSNALLLGALLVTPSRWWWLLVATIVPAHLMAQLQWGLPLPVALVWLVSNVIEAVTGAALARWSAGGRVRLNSVRAVVTFLGAATAGSVLSSYFAAVFLRLAGVELDPVEIWHARMLSNMLATLTFTTVIVAWWDASRGLRQAGRRRMGEAGALLLLLAMLGVAAFGLGWIPQVSSTQSLWYLPVPLLIWAAVRFGPGMASLTFAAVSVLMVWGSTQGRGPFPTALERSEEMALQLFLISLVVSQMLLAALVEERRQYGRRLSASRELFSRAVHASADAIAIANADTGVVLEANRSWRALLPHERRGVAPARLAPLAPYLDAADAARLAAMLAEGVEVRDVEMVVRDVSGQVHNALITLSPVMLPDLECMFFVVPDITPQRQAELDAQEQRQQLTHAARVASLTEFSTTLAHEISQPLTAILSSAQAAQRFVEQQPGCTPAIRSILEDIVEADKRAMVLIQYLRRMVKKGDVETALLDLNQLVQDVAHFMRGELLRRDVQIALKLAPDLPPVRGDGVQLQQLVLNLMSNACDAMQHNDTPRCLTVISQAGERGGVHLQVCDTGPGIKAEHRARLFEPFFTTKKSGLGLGLPICQKIAQAHGGSLRLQPLAPHGTSFWLELPQA